MELIIKNFDMLSKWKQEKIQDIIAGQCDVDLVDQMSILCKWKHLFKEKHGLEPVQIDLENVIKLIETGRIDDQDLSIDLNQTTLDKFR